VKPSNRASQSPWNNSAGPSWKSCEAIHLVNAFSSDFLPDETKRLVIEKLSSGVRFAAALRDCLLNSLSQPALGQDGWFVLGEEEENSPVTEQSDASGSSDSESDSAGSGDEQGGSIDPHNVN